jgi:ubiquinol-cytochrome c reductase cytochrome c subunit
MVDRASASPVGPNLAPPRSPGPKRSPSGRRVLVGYALIFGVLVLLLAAGGVVAGAVSSGASEGSPSTGNAVTDVSAGENLFLTSCASCHGPQGAGTAVAPDIRQAGAAAADFVLRTGRMPLADLNNPGQRGAPLFDNAQIEALVSYVASLGNGPAIPNVVTAGADTARGRDLFVANCAACHGPGGGGGAVGGGFVAPPLVGDSATTVGEAAITGPGPMPRFSFAPDELNDLAAYVEYLNDVPHPGGATGPAVGPVTEGFVAGMVLLGLLLVARWVAVRRQRSGSDDLPAADAGSGTE